MPKLVVNPLITYRYRCHKILTSASVAITEGVDMENQDDRTLLSLIGIFKNEVENTPLPENSDLCMFV